MLRRAFHVAAIAAGCTALTYVSTFHPRWLLWLIGGAAVAALAFVIYRYIRYGRPY